VITAAPTLLQYQTFIMVAIQRNKFLVEINTSVIKPIIGIITSSTEAIIFPNATNKCNGGGYSIHPLSSKGPYVVKIP
jgi:hypothetical protein